MFPVAFDKSKLRNLALQNSSIDDDVILILCLCGGSGVVSRTEFIQLRLHFPLEQ